MAVMFVGGVVSVLDGIFVLFLNRGIPAKLSYKLIYYFLSQS